MKRITLLAVVGFYENRNVPRETLLFRRLDDVVQNSWKLLNRVVDQHLVCFTWNIRLIEVT